MTVDEFIESVKSWWVLYLFSTTGAPIGTFQHTNREAIDEKARELRSIDLCVRIEIREYVKK